MQRFPHFQHASGFPHFRGYEDYYAGWDDVAGCGEGFPDSRTGLVEWALLPTPLGPPMVAEKAYHALFDDGGSGGGGGGRGGGGGGGRGGRSTDWSGVAKIGLIVGGALAIFFIYRASKGAEPVAERLGNTAARIMAARSFGSSGGARTSGSRLLNA
jgi:hypothetical protein